MIGLTVVDSMSRSRAPEEEEERFHDSLDRLLSFSNTSDDYNSNHYDVWISHPASVQERRIHLLTQFGLNRPSLSFYHDTFNSFVSHDAAMVRSNSAGECNSHQGDVCSSNLERSASSNRSSVSNSVSPNKPPKVKVRNGYNCNETSGISFAIPKSVGSNGSVDANAMCMIKNLDNGKEFVVKEVKEDGTWKKIKELGTGRHLTMEEFSSEMCVGTSPIVQELMRRQNVEDGDREGAELHSDGTLSSASKSMRRGSWLKSIKNVASSVTGHKDRRSSDERDTSSDKGGRRSSSATDDSQDVSFHGPEKVRVRHYGKSVKELTAMYKSQEIQAHSGSVWAIKFSLDGRYLASAGEDCVIHVWQVVETERKGDFLFDKLEDGNFNLLLLANGSPEPSSLSPNLEGHFEKKRRGRSSVTRKFLSLEQIFVPETVFSLLEKPICSFQGHLDDVLDLSWSKSQVS